MAQSGRTYSAARFAVVIDGTPAGFAVSVSGGERFAEVLERPGTGGLVDKHLGPVQFEPIVLEIGAAPGPLLDWVRDALAGAAKPHNGVISLLDYTNRERQRLEWTNGVARRDRLPDRRRRRPQQTPASTSRSAPSRRDSPPVRTAWSARSRRSARSRSATATSVWRSPGSSRRAEDPNRLGGHLPAPRRPRRRRRGSPGRWRSGARGRRRHLHRADPRRTDVPGMVRRPRQRHGHGANGLSSPSSPPA